MIAEDESQDQSNEEDDAVAWEQEVRARRRRLFKQEQADVPQLPQHKRTEEDQPRTEDELRAQIDDEVADIHLASMARRRAEADSVPAPKPPKIESDFSAFPSVPFRKVEKEKQAGMLPGVGGTTATWSGTVPANSPVGGEIILQTLPFSATIVSLRIVAGAFAGPLPQLGFSYFAPSHAFILDDSDPFGTFTLSPSTNVLHTVTGDDIGNFPVIVSSGQGLALDSDVNFDDIDADIQWTVTYTTTAGAKPQFVEYDQ